MRSLAQWGVRRSGAALSVSGIDRETGKHAKIWPVELVWVEEGRVFAAIDDDVVELAL